MVNLSPAVMMEIEKMAASSPEQRLMQVERAMGFAVLHPGEVPWLPAADWHRATLASTKGRRVRLVLLDAINPGHGALRRLVRAITALELEPVVVEPTGELADILQRWGWRSRRIGKGFTSQQVWYPRP